MEIDRKECEIVGPQGSEPVKVLHNERELSWKEQAHHLATGHAAHAEWCKHCVSGRGQSGLHRHHRRERTERTVPAIILDYCFPKGCARSAPGQEREHRSAMKTKATTDHHSGATLVRNVKTDGIGHGKMCKIIYEWLQGLACGRVVMKSDGEKSTLNIVEAVQMIRGRGEIVEHSPIGESSSNGGQKSKE